MSSAIARALLAELADDDDLLDELAAKLARRLPTSAPATPWLSVAAAAERMSCGRDRIYDLIQLGKLKPRRDGRRVLLRTEDIDDYLESGR